MNSIIFMFSRLAIGDHWMLSLLLISDALAFISIPSILLSRSGQPRSALTWLVIVNLMPIIGVFTWWLIGRRYLVRAKRKKITRSKEFHQSYDSSDCINPQDISHDFPLLFPQTKTKSIETYGYYPPTKHNAVELLSSGQAAFASMEEHMQSATHSIHLMFYIWQDDQTGRLFCNLLKQALQRGVKVWVLIDGAGSTRFAKHLSKELQNLGAHIAIFHPFQYFTNTQTLNFRNHRKLLVLDQKVAFIGGMNIGDEYKFEWRDLAVKIIGPAVHQLLDVFYDDYYAVTKTDISLLPNPNLNSPQGLRNPIGCAVIASGPTVAENFTHDALFTLISTAKICIEITTPYFIPSQPLLTAMRMASMRGVEIKILLPKNNDVTLVGYASRNFYHSLLQSGVQIFEYNLSMLHRKSLTIDTNLTLVGSANVDSRSFRLNFELSTLLQSSNVNQQVKKLFKEDLRHSNPIKIENLCKRTTKTRLLESAVHLLSPLL